MIYIYLKFHLAAGKGQHHKTTQQIRFLESRQDRDSSIAST